MVFINIPTWRLTITSHGPDCMLCFCQFVQLRVGGCVCLPVWDGEWTFAGPTRAHFSLSVHAAAPVCTHLPYDKEDESGAQHQGEHIAEGRKGECHGCASQPDDGLRETERERAPFFTLCPFVAVPHSPSLFLDEDICFPLGCELQRPGGWSIQF